MKYTKSYIGEIIKFYVENPIYIFLSISLSILFLMILLHIIPDWTLYQYMTIWLISIPTFILIVGHIFGYWKETRNLLLTEMLDKEYSDFLKNPFEIHFIIPPRNKYKIDYYKQTNIPQRVDKIHLPTNKKRTIFLWINPKVDLDIREQQFGFGDKPTNPKILKYDDSFATESNVPQTYFIDWWDNYHIVDKISKGKDDVIVHGFEIETHDIGEYTLDIRINVSSDRYKNVEKYKTYIPHYTNLKINVVQQE